MKVRSVTGWCLGLGAALAAPLAAAHHAIVAKFDDTKRTELRGIVTSVDWRNPHVHVFTNVTRDDGSVENWAVELESTVLLRRSGWKHDTLRPGDAISVSGPAHATARARSGAKPSSRRRRTGRSTTSRTGTPWRAAVDAPAPRGADGKPLLGAADASGGYWAYPTSTVFNRPAPTCA